MKCDMCGKEEAKFEVEIEGTRMNVGTDCSKFGKLIRKIRPTSNVEQKREQKIIIKKEEKLQLIVTNYSNIVKSAREKKGLKQEEVAKQIHEKESVIHNIESGRREPRLELARKLEKFFGITLIENYQKEKFKQSSSKDLGMTVGDMISVKTRKKL